MNKIVNVIEHIGTKELYQLAKSKTPICPEIEAVAKLRFESLEQLYAFMESRDVLTDAIYGKPDAEGKVTFPPAKSHPKEGLVLKHSTIGDQTSQYHKESIAEHMALVTVKLRENGVSPRLAPVIAVMHDCAKKYTSCTNNRGEVSFYGHEVASAYLAVRWMQNMGCFSEQEIKDVYIVTRGHMHPIKTWKDAPEKKAEFEQEVKDLCGEEHAKQTWGLLEAMFQSDDKCVTYEEREQAQDRFRAGKGMIQNGPKAKEQDKRVLHTESKKTQPSFVKKTEALRLSRPAKEDTRKDIPKKDTPSIGD